MLPNNFNSWEHFQKIWMRTHNRNVREQFSDVGDENWNPDINTPRGSLRVACTMVDTDTVQQCLARWLFFHGDVRQWEQFNEPVYGVPVGIENETRKYKPQVRLFFKEDLDQVEEGYYPLTGEINFRLMDESTESITMFKLENIARQIKTEFGAKGGFRWHRGRYLLSYNDWAKGYKLQILCFSEAVGKEIIQKTLNIQNHTPDWANLTVSQNGSPSAAFPTIPELEIVLGKRIRKPRKRGSGYVRFLHATCKVWGLTKPVALYDRSYRLLNPLVEVR